MNIQKREIGLNKGFTIKQKLVKVKNVGLKIGKNSLGFLRKNRKSILKILLCTVVIIVFKSKVALAQEGFDPNDILWKGKQLIYNELMKNMSDLMAKKKRQEELALVGKNFLTVLAEQKARAAAEKAAAEAAQKINLNLLGGQDQLIDKKTLIAFGQFGLVIIRSMLSNTLLHPSIFSNQILRKKIDGTIFVISSILYGSDFVA